MNKDIETLAKKRDYKIAIANEVIDEMRMGLTAKQQNVLDFMLKEIKADDKPDKRYSISIDDYCRINNITNMKNSKNYSDVKKGVKELNNNSKWINIDKHKIQLVYWFRNIVINQETNTIEYNIDDTIVPYLFGLIKTGNYTQYAYRETVAMESKYSKSLYRILLRYYNTGITNPIIPLEKLKTLLAAENYTRYPDFSRYVLDIAEREINQFTKLKVSYEPKKEVGSRAYTHIIFTLNRVKGGEELDKRERASIEAFGEENLYPPI